jgi:hypothetical protein
MTEELSFFHFLCFPLLLLSPLFPPVKNKPRKWVRKGEFSKSFWALLVRKRKSVIFHLLQDIYSCVVHNCVHSSEFVIRDQVVRGAAQ